MEIFEKKEPSFQDTVPGRIPIDPPEASITPRPPANNRLIFTGLGSEYFKIWAVNLALTIVTLSVYSAWAKVRRLRYFYANTSLADATFDFHGAPMAILRGRIIALVMVVAYTQSPKISLPLYGVVLFLIAAGFPWLFWRSLKFRYANTSYRGVRFGFSGTVLGCYAAMGPPILMFLFINAFPIFLIRLDPAVPAKYLMWSAFGVVYVAFLATLPYFYYRVRAYQHRGARFGQGVFEYRGGPGPFYLICLVGVITATAILCVAGVVAAAVGMTNGGFSSNPATPKMPPVSFWIAIGVGYLLSLCLLPLATAASQNVVWRATTLNSRRFHSDLSGWRMVWIQLSNLVLTVLTLGIFWPFAMIRSARAKTQAVRFFGDPAQFAASESDTIGATGSEFTEMIGFDIAL